MKFNFLLLLICFCILGNSCDIPNKKANCNLYKSGKFLYHFPEKEIDILIERNDTIQTEINFKTNSLTVFKINWISSCDYELRFVSQSNTSNNSTNFKMKDAVLKTTILSANENYSICKSQVIGYDKINIDTIRIFKGF